MKVVLSNHTINLMPKDVLLAKKVIRKFLDCCKTKAEKYGAHSFYYTLLVTMYVMSNDLIEAITPEILATILNARAKNETK